MCILVQAEAVLLSGLCSGVAQEVDLIIAVVVGEVKERTKLDIAIVDATARVRRS